MGGVVQTLLAYLLGDEHPRMKRNYRTLFTLLDLHLACANRAVFSLGDKFDTGKRLAGIGRGARNRRRRPAGTLRMQT